jgi:hypothetical protein
MEGMRCLNFLLNEKNLLTFDAAELGVLLEDNGVKSLGSCIKEA